MELFEDPEVIENGCKKLDDLPVLCLVQDVWDLIGSRQEAYRLAHILGRRVGSKFIIPKSALKAWFEEQGA